ncbi:Nephrocystin-1 [Gonapodya sp. JEL0774]|nr:Nephrocystin-1 [Gonapodya sp. JEL0774]
MARLGQPSQLKMPPSTASPSATHLAHRLSYLSRVRRRWSSVSERVRSDFGEVPSTFAESVLGRARREGKGSVIDCLQPARAFHGVGLADIGLDANTNEPLPHPVPTVLTLTLHGARGITPPGADCRVLARHIRCALWEEGTGLVGNIHTVPAGTVDEGGGEWRFSKKPSLLYPPRDSSTLLVRADRLRPGLCLLIEACVVLARLNGNGDRDDGECAAFRGGSPLDSLSAPPPSPAPRARKKSVWEAAVGAVLGGGGDVGDAVVEVRVWGGKVAGQVDTLPAPLVCSLLLLPTLVQYRHLLARALLPNPTVEPDLRPRFDPTVALVPVILEREDMAEVLAKAWEVKLKQSGKSEKLASSPAHVAIFRSGPTAAMSGASDVLGWKPFDVLEVGWGGAMQGMREVLGGR